MKTPFHILIIEDNPDDIADIRQMLLRGSDVHYRFTEASTGAMGLRACREVGDAAPDLVLLDFYLPDMDAKLILAELRGDNVLTPFPVVVITGSDTVSGPEMLRAGAQDYIGKSWATPESLMHLIENAVERFRLLTDRGQVDARLRESEERHRLAIDAAEMGTWDWDMANDEILWSPHHETLFGYEPGTPRRSFADFQKCVHAEDAERVAATVSEAVEQRQEFRCQYRVIWPDGSVHWIAGFGRFHYDSEGRPIRMIGIVEDITDRKQAEERLRASEERLALGTQVSELALAEVDYTTGLNHLTVRAAHLFGLGDSAVALPRAQIHATFHPADREELERRIAQSLDPAGSGWFAMEHRVVWPDGEVRWLSVRKRVFFTGENAARRPARATFAALDVTAEKAAAEAVRTSEERMRLATEATAVGIWERNVRTNALRWDAQMFRLYGIAPTPDGFVQYSDWSGAVLPEDLPENERILEDTMRRCGQSRREFRIRRRNDNEVRHIEAVETVRTNASGEPAWVVGTNLDITAHKQAEGKMAAMNEQLLISSLSQHELTEEAEKLNARLRAEIAERKQAEGALRVSEEKFRGMVESSHDCIKELDLEGRLLSMNHSGQCLMEIDDLNSFLNASWPDFWKGDDYDAARSAVAVARAGGVRAFEGFYLTARGRPTWWSVVVTPVLGSAGEPVRLLVVSRDITERKGVEEKISASERETKLALEYAEATLRTTPVPFLVLRADLRVNTASEAFYTDFKVAPAETEGRLIYEIGNGQWNIPKLRELLEEIIPKKKVFNGFEVTHEFATIGTRTMLLNARRMDNAEGVPERILLAIEDITERVLAEEVQSRLGAIVSSADDGILSKGLDGVVTTWNASAERLFGYTAEEIIGNPNLHLTPPDLLHEEVHILKQILSGKAVEHFETQRMTKDGRRLPVSLTVSPIKDPMGNVVGASKIVRDITERKQAEQALIAAKEHAEAANKAKDNFLATLSHELRTPLTPVLMMATALACDPSLPAEAREQLDMMRRNIELEARLIDDLLDLTRIIHGKFSIERVPADVHDLLHHTNEIIRSDGLGKHLRITLKLDAAHHHALADPARLQQVFWNLLRNAVKFTPDGGTITVSSRNDAAGRIIVCVADDGIGIRAEVLAQIFDAFEQADTTGEHRYGGLGLGLAISSAIVTAHGGEIKAESQGRGHGAEFTVTLGSVPAPAAASQENATPAQPAGGLALLVVEDHDATRTVLERLLTRSGHRVTTAATVQAALAAYKAAHFDAVISDLGLPDGSGIELMEQIQNIRPVPAIALSGYGMEDDLQRSKAAGFYAHLVKPVKVDQLKQLLAQIPAQVGQGCA